MAGGKIDILVEPDLKGFSSKLEGGLSGGLGVATKIGSAIGLALGGAATVKGIAEIGIEFDKQMNTMAAVSQASASELAAVEVRARELGKSSDLTATSASDAAAAMVELTKGGFTVQESMDAAKGTLQLASAAQVDAATAATIQSQALQSFGLDASYAATASDVLAGAANASSAEIEGIAHGLSQSGAVANQFGLTLEDNATALAMFANAGIQGSDAGTLLKSALLAMTKDSKPARAAIEELGLTLYDTQGKFVGLESLFGQLEVASKSMTEEQYQAATATLFGSDAMRLAGVAAEQGAEGWDKTYQAVTRAGQASEVAAAQAQGLPGVLEAIENQAEDTGLAIYDAFSDLALQGGQALVGMLEVVGPQIEGFAKLAATGIASTAEFASGFTSLTGPVLGAAAALALSSWADFPGRMNAGTASIGNFIAQAKTQQSIAKLAGREIGLMAGAMAAVEARSPAIAAAGTAYRSYGTNLRAAGQQTKMLAMQTTGLHTNMLLAKGTAQSFAGVLSGGVASGMSLVKTGASGLMGALGGPWGLAITAAGLGIGALVQKHQEAAAAEAEHAAQQDALRDSLDQTTGAITEQTGALQMKTAQENGWLSTATELNLAHSVVQDAMAGNTAAQNQVKAAVEGATTAAIKGTDFWQEYGTRMEEAGVSADILSAAQNGNVDAGRKVSAALDEVGDKSRSAHNIMRREVEETTGAYKDFADGVSGAADDLSEAQLEQQAAALNQLRQSAQSTTDVLKLLGESVIGIEDEKTITVSADSVTAKTKEELEEIGAIASDPIDGKVSITMDGGFDVLQIVEQLGLKLGEPFEGYVTIEASSLEEAQAQAEALGLQVKEIDGRLVIDSDAPETNEQVLELIRNAQNMQGNLEISDNSAEVSARAYAALHGKIYRSTYQITTEYINSGGGAAPLSRAMQADGGVMEFYGNGGVREDHVAQIAPAGTWRVWAEPETGGEAYIPLAPEKRVRSINILEEVARRFGMAVIPKTAEMFVSGGFSQVARGISGGFQSLQAQALVAVPRGTIQAVEDLRLESIKLGNSLSGTLLDQTEEVQQAYEELTQAQKSHKDSLKAVSQAERRIRDQEESLADARKSLNKVNEDAKSTEEDREKALRSIRDAEEDLESAHEGLAEAHERVEDAANSLAKAEDDIAASRFRAIARLSTTIGDSLAQVANGISELFAGIAQQAEIMEQTRQRLIAERIERQAADLAEQRARIDLAIAERDIASARAYGAIRIADAEAALEAARAQAALKGQTGIDAMSQALDRARRTGIFAVDDVAQSVIDNAAEVRAAQHAVDAARAQAVQDELDAAYRQRTAVLDLAQATLTQQKAVALVDISTRQLQEQAARLGGMTSQGAKQASNGWGGLGGLFGGLGKIVGGIAGAVGSLATGNVIGAVVSGVSAIQGLGEALKGGRDAISNRNEIKESWDGMSTIDKIITGGGLLLGGGVAASGGLASGALGLDVTSAAAVLGAEIASQAVGYAGHGITSDLEKINLQAEEERDLLLLKMQLDQAKLDAERAKLEMEYLTKSQIASSNVEIAELLGKIALADTTQQADALANAAVVAAERRDRMIEILARQLEIEEGQPKHNIVVPIPEDGWIHSSTLESMIDIFNRIQSEVDVRKEQISGADYMAART